jgi:hypothetical protein
VSRHALSFLLVPLLTGCFRGLVYRHTTVPFTRNFHATPSDIGGGREGSCSIKHFEIPISRYRLDFRWDSNAVGDAAKAGGLRTIHYADLETFSILGIWNQYFVHVYGE